jgi:hypothetical protein
MAPKKKPPSWVRNAQQRGWFDKEEWEWLDDIPPPPADPTSRQVVRHTSASRAGQIYRTGDIVQIYGKDSYKWLALIRGFEGLFEPEEEESQWVLVIWFNRQQDVPIQKRREGAHAVCSFGALLM